MGLKIKGKKGQTGLIVAIIIIVLIICIGILVILDTQRDNSITGNVIKTMKNCKMVSVPYTDTICEEKEIPFNIQNFVMDSQVCNDENKICEKSFLGFPYNCETYCADKTISCSLDLRNLDNEERGTWGIEFTYTIAGTSKVVGEKRITKFLYPKTTEKVGTMINIQSQGVGGEANENIRCSYNVYSTPTKSVCRDVTKYKMEERCN